MRRPSSMLVPWLSKPRVTGTFVTTCHSILDHHLKTVDHQGRSTLFAASFSRRKANVDAVKLVMVSKL
jgi:hypothetical protein